jgi:hypothetical protein
MSDSQFRLDPSQGVVCCRAGHLVAEQMDEIPACPRCGKGLCPQCTREGVRLDTCPLGDTYCANV